MQRASVIPRSGRVQKENILSRESDVLVSDSIIQKSGSALSLSIREHASLLIFKALFEAHKTGLLASSSLAGGRGGGAQHGRNSGGPRRRQQQHEMNCNYHNTNEHDESNCPARRGICPQETSDTHQSTKPRGYPLCVEGSRSGEQASLGSPLQQNYAKQPPPSPVPNDQSMQQMSTSTPLSRAIPAEMVGTVDETGRGHE